MTTGGTFSDPRAHPSTADLKERLGRAFSPYEQLLSRLQACAGGISTDWKYSKKSGWYIVGEKSKKRIFYLFPVSGDFDFKMVFNENALRRIIGGKFTTGITAMLHRAPKYPEGTLLEFHRENFDVEAIVALINIKAGS